MAVPLPLMALVMKGQGAIVTTESAATDIKFSYAYSLAGTLGFGVDVLGMAGFKLDSDGGTAGTNLLPPDLSGGSQDRYGELGLTAKMRVSNSTLKFGTLQIEDPVVRSNDTRLLPGRRPPWSRLRHGYPSVFLGDGMFVKAMHLEQYDMCSAEQRCFEGADEGELPSLPLMTDGDGSNAAVRLDHAAPITLHHVMRFAVRDSRAGSVLILNQQIRPDRLIQRVQ